MKTISQICPKCSQPIPGDAPGLLCPRCLVAGGFTESKVGTQNDQHPESALSLVFAEESSLPPGAPRKLGDYEIVEVIARGGMGIVYKAWQPGLERFVAVKTISSGLLATPIDVERFQREAKLAAKLRHPNIVSIHEIGEQEGQHFFAMDYVPGESLAALARKQPFLPEQAAQIVAAIAEAVHYAHQQGVLHRDLKPANVILSPDGPRVLDLGVTPISEGNLAAGSSFSEIPGKVHQVSNLGSVPVVMIWVEIYPACDPNGGTIFVSGPRCEGRSGKSHLEKVPDCD
ncbi:MAG TPA: protein kinase [Verrucomicrobiae bacterium]|jgi:serine/threonine protein kinase|nr:protein kinase [Verrucomicrobiae bacterium]